LADDSHAREPRGSLSRMRLSGLMLCLSLSACTAILGDDFYVLPGGAGGNGGPCTPGEITCADAMTLSTCPDGQVVLEACPAETPVCAGSACVVCEDGAARCNGDNVEHCTMQAWAPAESCD